MKKAIIATAIAAATTIGFSASASASGGNSDAGKLHPGHVGYIQTETNGGGVPPAYFHDSGSYPIGPGGWGGYVSDAAKGGGNPGAHP